MTVSFTDDFFVLATGRRDADEQLESFSLVRLLGLLHTQYLHDCQYSTDFKELVEEAVTVTATHGIPQAAARLFEQNVCLWIGKIVVFAARCYA